MRGAVRFYFMQFLFGFGRHVPLVLTSGLVFVLVFVSDVNQAFGIRNLLWHEDEVKQGAVGFALGVVIVQTLLAGYLLETQRTPSGDRPSISTFGPAIQSMFDFVPETLALRFLSHFEVTVMHSRHVAPSPRSSNNSRRTASNMKSPN